MDTLLDVWKAIWRNPGNWLRLRVHNRLMLYNTLIILAVAYVLAFISTQYALRLNTVTQLQQSRDTLNALYNYYDRKHDQFLNLLFPLYDDLDNYNVISRLMESTDDQEYVNDPFAKKEIVQMMQGIAVRDPDISEVLLRKNVTGAQYVYNVQKRTLALVPDEYPFFKQLKDKKGGRSVYGTRTFKNGQSVSAQNYGIAGTLGTATIRQNAGQLLIAYDTRALERLYQASNGKTLGRFVIVSEDGELIFDTDNRYDDGAFPYMEALRTGAATANIDGESYYIQTISGKNRNYITANLVPKAFVDNKSSGIPYLIFGAVTVMAFVCALLYSIAGSFTFRRMRELVKAMKFIGLNNLSYRVPVHGKHDEFEQLAKQFNTMCDELQEGINREYFSEIRKKNAELVALQAGINPHFLYNTLEAIRIKAMDDGNVDVAEMIVLLANLYRSMVRDHTFIPIRKELNLCSMYMTIFSLRYANSLEYEMDVDPLIMEYGIPKNLLQPIIENYFVHGIREQDDHNRFVIRGTLQDGDIVFFMDDNGRGMDPARLETVRALLESNEPAGRTSYGLRNVHERIRLVYGTSFGISLETEQNSRTRIIVRIPAMTIDGLSSRINVLTLADGIPREKSRTFS